MQTMEVNYCQEDFHSYFWKYIQKAFLLTNIVVICQDFPKPFIMLMSS